MRFTFTAPSRHSQLTAWMLALVCALGVWAGADSSGGGQNQSQRADLATGADALFLAHTEQSIAVKRTYFLDRNETHLDTPDDDWHVLVDEQANFQSAQNATHPLLNNDLAHVRPPVGQLLNAPRAPPTQHS